VIEQNLRQLALRIGQKRFKRAFWQRCEGLVGRRKDGEGTFALQCFD